MLKRLSPPTRPSTSRAGRASRVPGPAGASTAGRWWLHRPPHRIADDMTGTRAQGLQHAFSAVSSLPARLSLLDTPDLALSFTHCRDPPPAVYTAPSRPRSTTSTFCHLDSAPRPSAIWFLHLVPLLWLDSKTLKAQLEAQAALIADLTHALRSGLLHQKANSIILSRPPPLYPPQCCASRCAHGGTLSSPPQQWRHRPLERRDPQPVSCVRRSFSGRSICGASRPVLDRQQGPWRDSTATNRNRLDSRRSIDWQARVQEDGSLSQSIAWGLCILPPEPLSFVICITVAGQAALPNSSERLAAWRQRSASSTAQ
ncbi:hypothetical protein PMIN01_03465 [Paraphaeosphaeria minitans]|uniref:Uncharacterized protein n=1 Tax=Paraphaeosphaeria minitans TaxID=565426 RepID=A0A9P6GLZ2_9PLEO|nr:hypothetical protein PMIN01_03465 [Paraphaeosphaeria minitans]